MKLLRRTRQFKKDVKLARKQGKDFSILKKVIEDLCGDRRLDEKYRDHNLKGNLRGFRECHLETDWRLIYENSETTITLRRMGSHAGLFAM